MNFLAHLYLSEGSNEQIIAGNFFGDFVKGKSHEDYSADFQAGVLLHREIDRFTDHHPVVIESKKRLRPTFHHYSPVIVDVFYDHFLASLWLDYRKQSLEDYTNEFYSKMDPLLDQMPKRAAQMFQYMRRDNWLLNYQSLEGIHQALNGMASRTPFQSKMEDATAELRLNYEHYKSEFLTFFPDLTSHSKSYLDSLL